MSILSITCNNMGRDLSEILKQCRILKDRVHEYESIASTFFPALTKLNLTMLHVQMSAACYCLRKEHQDWGCVFIMITETGLGIRWAETELSQADYDWFKRRGIRALSPEAFSDIMEKFRSDLDSGKWEVVLKFTSQYGAFY